MNLRDDVIPDEKAWVSTVDFMVSKLNLEQNKLQQTIQDLRGTYEEKIFIKAVFFFVFSFISSFLSLSFLLQLW